MKQSEIMALQNEPACGHNNKAKSGCAKPKPNATQGGCSFDGAQIALLPICDAAHIVHGPIVAPGVPGTRAVLSPAELISIASA